MPKHTCCSSLIWGRRGGAKINGDLPSPNSPLLPKELDVHRYFVTCPHCSSAAGEASIIIITLAAKKNAQMIRLSLAAKWM
jgi:hypothetical protein